MIGDKAQQFGQCCDEAFEVYTIKDADYDSNYEEVGVIGVTADLLAVVARLKKLVMKAPDHGRSNRESILNVALDAHNFANLLKMVVLTNNWEGKDDEENSEKL